jgi:hypothetical protein
VVCRRVYLCADERRPGALATVAVYARNMTEKIRLRQVAAKSGSASKLGPRGLQEASPAGLHRVEAEA